MPEITQHRIERGDGSAVELLQAVPDTAKPAGGILFVHGNQGGLRIGAHETVDSGTLVRFSSRLGITAAAVSQPGFGGSDGPPDFCGPATQRAIRSALDFLCEKSDIDASRVVLYGYSRGAVASAMVAAQIANLGAVILGAGVYDLEAAYRTASPGIRFAIEQEAGTSRAAFAARSGLLHAEKIRSETLLLHGRHDDRAPFAQAEQFAATLSRNGRTVSLHVFECGHRIPHEFSREAIRPLLKRMFGAPIANG